MIRPEASLPIDVPSVETVTYHARTSDRVDCVVRCERTDLSSSVLFNRQHLWIFSGSTAVKLRSGSYHKLPRLNFELSGLEEVSSVVSHCCSEPKQS